MCLFVFIAGIFVCLFFVLFLVFVVLFLLRFLICFFCLVFFCCFFCLFLGGFVCVCSNCSFRMTLCVTVGLLSETWLSGSMVHGSSHAYPWNYFSFQPVLHKTVRTIVCGMVHINNILLLI